MDEGQGTFAWQVLGAFGAVFGHEDVVEYPQGDD